MRKFIVYNKYGKHEIDADCISFNETNLEFIQKHIIIAGFKEWDFWYEKSNQETEKENQYTSSKTY
jgi:hypothetical protein